MNLEIYKKWAVRAWFGCDCDWLDIEFIHWENTSAMPII